VSAFDRLHPALQHHIVNSLGWKALRQFQEDAIAPLLDGHHALLIAPTAGGKTEAAFFPILSRMLTEEWPGTSVLYICPLRALLNNLEVRLREYCALVGRTVALWHGDISHSARQRIMAEPPDCLMITPESIEVILVSRRWNRDRAFGGIRAAIVDEIHAFAGDDRGWHLLAVLERVTKLANREIQRVGLSATVGNPPDLLNWLAGSCERPRSLIGGNTVPASRAHITLDDVGSLDNAATVIARLHRGEKRLVFCDSRADVESLSKGLRRLGVDTYLSHSSLSREERVRAETAFAQNSNCVIVSTSTLELGIDVGDLDRVIQVGAPWTVSSFLQRLGRTGRRPGSERNCLFLTTSRDAFLRATGIARLHAQGFVDPIEPPPLPLHIFAQQLMALALQQGGIGASSWQDWIGRMPGFKALDEADIKAVLNHMLSSDILSLNDGILWFGESGERKFRRRNFMELLSSFTSEPLFAVRYGRQHLGSVDFTSFMLGHDEPQVLLLGGRSWVVNQIDWESRTAFVEPIGTEEGKSRWRGSGQPLSFEFCQAIKAVLEGVPTECEMSKRAAATLKFLREEYSWLATGRSAVVFSADRARWWTFAGVLANVTLTTVLRKIGLKAGKADNFSIQIDDRSLSPNWEPIADKLRAISFGEVSTSIDSKALDQLKFSTCLPRDLGFKELRARLSDAESYTRLVRQPVSVIKEPDSQ
jgi:ATP-dependent Lhr-like helicase